MDENSLIAALRKAEAEKYAAVPPEDEIEHAFSDGFRQKMDRLIRMQRQSVWNLVKTPARRSLLLLLILLLTFGVPPEKNPLFRIIQPIPQLSTVAPSAPEVSLPQPPPETVPVQTEPKKTEPARLQTTDPVKPNAAAQPEEHLYLPPEQSEQPLSQRSDPVKPGTADQPEERSYLPPERSISPAQEESAVLPQEAVNHYAATSAQTPYAGKASTPEKNSEPQGSASAEKDDELARLAEEAEAQLAALIRENINLAPYGDQSNSSYSIFSSKTQDERLNEQLAGPKLPQIPNPQPPDPTPHPPWP